MESLTLTMAEVCAALERGASVVTGNQRAARALHGAYRRGKRAAGRATWDAPTVLPWDAWAASLWQTLVIEGIDERVLLSGLQEQMLWREIIQQDKEQSAELSTLEGAESLAEVAARGWGLLGAYGGRGELKGTAGSMDTKAFVRWTERFERRCKGGGLLSSAQLEEELQGAVAKKRLKVGGEILLVGFDGLTRAQEELVRALKANGCEVRGVALQVSGEGTKALVAAETEAEELRAVAHWARKMLEEIPGVRVGVIVPRLEEERAEIDRVFRDVLAPELQEIDNRSGAPYEFSLGGALGSAHMVAAAMDLLRWTTDALPVERISALLLSPYFGRSAILDRGIRAEFDAFVLRQVKALRPEFGLRWMAEATAVRLPTLSRLLTAMHRHSDTQGFSSGRERSYGEWMEDVRGLLCAAEWPGARGMDSVEFQTREKWEHVLDSIATLDFSGERVPFSTAIAELERTLRGTLFAAESRNAPVQILGVLESAGSDSDALWFLRGGDMAWPTQAKPHPLLPWPLQRKYEMPGTNPAQTQSKARAIVARIAASAPSILFSYAGQKKEGLQHRSPVIAELAWPISKAASFLPQAVVTPAIALQETPDDAPLPLLPNGIASGGANILKLQAACGFRAFAERRLWSTELDIPESGMDARERGDVVHQILERFWKEVRTQDALRAMPKEKRAALLADCIAAATSRSLSDGSAWSAAYLETQRQRLQSLLSAWLEYELTRKPFTVRLSEKDFDDLSIGPLRLRLRVDRIDQSEAGEMVIDYKTGYARPGDWKSERPDEPQLPLYAVLAPTENLQAIAFAKVRTGKEMRLEGYDPSRMLLAKSAALEYEDLAEQIAYWRNVLTGLAQDFADGRADVGPKIYPGTCKHCAQRMLCRLDVSALEEGDEEDEENELD